MKRCLLGWALRRAARVIAVSRPLQEFAGSLGCRPERVRTIPNGVDAALFRPRDRRACRLRCSLPVEGRIVLSVGNLIELKGHHRVVAALGQLRRQGMAALLLIAGDAGREASAEPLIRAEIARWNLEDSVRFTGLLPAEKLADYMSAADLLCLASSREGSPNVIREALSCGTPVVATDVGGIPDLIPSEQYGLLVPARDTGALASALARALGAQWDREQIAAWGGQRSWEMVAREVFQELRAALAPPV
jgi:glycosyltransferase involved in cell wall biosynthesis